MTLNSSTSMKVIVTGAGKGIGFETATRFAEEGHEVLAISRNIEALKVKNDSFPNITPLSLDLTQSDFSLLDPMLKEWGEVDIIIHNAGYLVNAPFEEIKTVDLEKVYKVNVFAVFQLTQHLMPFLQASQAAHVIAISSMGGVQGASKFPGLSAYSSSKAAVAGIIECLAEEYRESNISFNALALGAVQTKMLEEAFPGYTALLSAQEMAAYVFDFALNGSKYYNGKILPVSATTP